MKTKYFFNAQIRQIKKKFKKEKKALYALKEPNERQMAVIEFCVEIKEIKHELRLFLNDLDKLNIKMAEEVLGINLRNLDEKP